MSKDRYRHEMRLWFNAGQGFEDARHKIQQGYFNGLSFEDTCFHRDNTESKAFIHSYVMYEMPTKDVEAVLKEYVRLWSKSKITAPIRQRLMADAWHPDSKGYLEARAQVWGQGDMKEAWELGFHISKRTEEDYHILMMRGTTPRPTFELNFQMGLSYLMNSGAVVGETSVERCLSDNHGEMDDKWIG